MATDVLAHVLERATGETMAQLLRKHIFDPLGMDNTSYCVPEAKRSRIMPMFGAQNVAEMNGLNPPATQILTPSDVDEMYPADNPDYSRGGHGLFSTTADYHKFATMLLSGFTPDGEIMISRKMLDMMVANRIPAAQLPLRIGLNPLGGYGWGLGVRVMMDIGQSLALTSEGEFGWAGAATTYFWVDPVEQMTGVLMTQYLGSILPITDDLKTAAYQML